MKEKREIVDDIYYNLIIKAYEKYNESWKKRRNKFMYERNMKKLSTDFFSFEISFIQASYQK